MADSACIIELASNAGEYFIDSALDDIMIHPRYATQKILLGNSNSQIPSVTVTSNAVGVFKTSPVYTLDVIGDINYTGSLLKNGSLVSTGGGGGGSGLSSQWASDVSNVYVGQNSNVGIGVSNPSTPLEVKGDTKISGNLIMNNRLIMSSLQINRRQGNHANITSTSVIGFSNVDDGVVISIASNTPAASQSFRVLWSNDEVFRVTGEGDIGIGTSNPSAKLHVIGSTIIDGDIDITGTITASGGSGSSLFSQWSNDLSNVFLGENSNVGIGISNPAYPLDVIGDINMIGAIRYNGAPYISKEEWLTSNAVTVSIGDGNGRASMDTFNIMWSNNKLFTVTGEGDIGIGTSNPFAKLHVIGNTIIDGDIDITGNITTSGGGSGLFSQWSNDFSNVFVGEYSNVGIGVSNPTTPLEVNGDATISGNLIMNNRLIMSSLQINRRQGNHANITSTSVKGFSNVSDGVIISIGSNTPAASQSLRAMWSNNEIFTVTGEGNIGIGTSNPTSKLHVNGTSRIDYKLFLRNDIVRNPTNVTIRECSDILNGSQSLSGQIILQKYYNKGVIPYNNTIGRIAFGGNHTDSNENVLCCSSINAMAEDNFTSSNNMPVAITFWTGSNGVNPETHNITMGTERMRVSAAGNVGIGTTIPAYKLDVAGDINYTGSLLKNGAPFTGSQWTSSASNIYIGSTSNVGIGTTAPEYPLHVIGTICASGDVLALSDKTAKSNLEVIAEPLSKIQQLNGYTYEMLDSVSDTTKLTSKYTGLIAQELMQVLPEAVHKDTEGKLSIAYGNVMGLVVEAIKALNEKYEKRIDELEKKIEQLSR